MSEERFGKITYSAFVLPSKVTFRSFIFEKFLTGSAWPTRLYLEGKK